LPFASIRGGFCLAGIVFCFRAIPLYALFVAVFVGFPVLRSVIAVVGGFRFCRP